MNGQDLLPAIRPDTGEARLWQAVIIQAIKNQDWKWFFPSRKDNGTDYLIVCRWAGLDPEPLRARVMEHALRQAAARSLAAKILSVSIRRPISLTRKKGRAHMPHRSPKIGIALSPAMQISKALAIIMLLLSTAACTGAPPKQISATDYVSEGGQETCYDVGEGTGDPRAVHVIPCAQ